MTLAIVIGALLGVVFAGLVRLVDRRRQVPLYAAGLVVAAAIYVVFALPAAGRGWLLVELGGLLLFTALAVAGRRRPALIALGWLLHVAWDGLLHQPTHAPFVPVAYPALCIGFDLVVAVAAYLAARRSDPH
ncbi:MAG: hypothetical protein D6696_09035 [Acidobacteria bacterium]|nr:MAG: hypothetical protein D6696_09035 [Acidobacteriota bacterium]